MELAWCCQTDPPFKAYDCISVIKWWREPTGTIIFKPYLTLSSSVHLVITVISRMIWHGNRNVLHYGLGTEAKWTVHPFLRLWVCQSRLDQTGATCLPVWTLHQFQQSCGDGSNKYMLWINNINERRQEFDSSSHWYWAWYSSYTVSLWRLRQYASLKCF